MALKSSFGFQGQLGHHQVVSTGPQLSNKVSSSLVLGIPLEQQAVPSLLVGGHPHLGSKSTLVHPVVSRSYWGHARFICLPTPVGFGLTSIVIPSKWYQSLGHRFNTHSTRSAGEIVAQRKVKGSTG